MPEPSACRRDRPRLLKPVHPPGIDAHSRLGHDCPLPRLCHASRTAVHGWGAVLGSVGPALAERSAAMPSAAMPGSGRRPRGAVTAEACVPLFCDPGEACRFDRSHGLVVIAGVPVSAKVAHAGLCHSRMMFVGAYMRESHEPRPSGSDRWRLDRFAVRLEWPGLHRPQCSPHARDLRQRRLSAIGPRTIDAETAVEAVFSG